VSSRSSAAPRTRRWPSRSARTWASGARQARPAAPLPGGAAWSRRRAARPPHDEFPDELGQGCEDVEDQPAAWGGGVQRLVPDRNPVPRRRSPATMVIRSCRGRDSRSRPGMTRGVAGAEVAWARGELGTAGGLARLLVGEDPDAVGLDTRRLGARPGHRTDMPPSASSAGHWSRPSHSTGTHPPQRGTGTHGAAALAVTGPPLSRWTQPCACRFALYWLRAATRASPAASTTSVDDARTATLRPGSSTSSSTSPTASLPGPTE